MTINHSNPQELFVSYTDYDISGYYGGSDCVSAVRLGIEVVHSEDGGSTWSKPAQVDEGCSDDRGVGTFLQGSQVVVDKSGTVFVAYEVYLPDGSRALRIARSTNHGATFAAPVTISQVTATGVQNGTFGLLQGAIRTNEFPSLAADPRTGELYVAWADGRNRQIIDVGAAFLGISPPTYAFGDVMISRSTNHGASWSAPRDVSGTSRSYTGIGRDQFMPGLAVDATGELAVCYYDRRNDPDNLNIDRYCSVSGDHGVHWTDHRKTVQSWSPAVSSDVLVAPTYLGDYDTTAVDALGMQKGFAGGFEIETNSNPDVYLARF